MALFLSPWSISNCDINHLAITVFKQLPLLSVTFKGHLFKYRDGYTYREGRLSKEHTI